MDVGRAARLYKTLGDENRLAIIELIAAQTEVCACSLLERLNVSQPTLSHHMKLLCDSGLVKARKEGRWMHYSLDEAGLSAAIEYLAKLQPELR